ncbi:MAG TPA: ABC transporter permease, partial [Armatimonadetes bacterium]|nr:ABC transporter permease [Armatimonadota bacterium]
MGRRIRAIARKEALHIARDPRALAVVLVLPVLLLVIYGYAVNFDIKHLPLGVADFDRSRVSRELVEAFTRTEYFDLVATTTRLAEVREWLDRGQVRLALVIPEGFAAQVVTGRSATVQFLVDGADANTASIALGYAELLLRWQAEQLVQRALQRWGTTGR